MLILTCFKGIHIYKRWLDGFPRKHLPPRSNEGKVKLTNKQRKQIKDEVGTEISEFEIGRLRRFSSVRSWFQRLFKPSKQLTPKNHDRATDVMDFVERWGSALMFVSYFVGKLILNVREWIK